jgi:hypothetical protein
MMWVTVMPPTMTNETIERIIDAVNAGTAADWIFTRPIAGNVSFGIVWPHEPEGKSVDESGYDFYFVYEPAGECVAAVLDMVCDLHVFTKERWRRQGIMTTALREIVLPHIFSKGRTCQEVTFESEQARGLLQKLGFKFADSTHASALPEDFPRVEFPARAPRRLSKGRVEVIERRLSKAAALARMVRDEIDGALDETLRDQIDSSARSLANRVIDVRDEWRDSELRHSITQHLV